MALSIKRLTASAHRDAEAAVGRARPFASLGSYRAYLTKLHAFYEALEAPLFERLALLVPDADARRKTGLLEADLRYLGALVDPAALGRPRVPRIASSAAAMGVGYVLEGKTLGSRFLLEHARQLDLDAGRGASFLAGYGGRTGPMWRVYRDALEHFVVGGGRRAAVVAGALATFASFTRWIDTDAGGTRPSGLGGAATESRAACPAAE